MVNPGADPNKIQLDIQGVDRISVDTNGDLVLHKGSDEVRLQAPVVYQEFHGLKVSVTGAYKVQNSTRVSFSLGEYQDQGAGDRSGAGVWNVPRRLLADDQSVGIAVDSDGSAYVAGWTQSTNFPAGLAGWTGAFRSERFRRQAGR